MHAFHLPFKVDVSVISVRHQLDVMCPLGWSRKWNSFVLHCSNGCKNIEGMSNSEYPDQTTIEQSDQAPRI